ncbi:MAG TPA: hypothetical protein VNO70_18510 [Blastocatellia bacterium]|nr:hypothetical protein [Blastocatellia bacterium]
MHYNFDLTRAVREAVNSFEGEFTVREVLNEVRKAHPEVPKTATTEIALRLNALALRREIIKVRRGTGGAPSLYRRNYQGPGSW